MLHEMSASTKQAPVRLLRPTTHWSGMDPSSSLTETSKYVRLLKATPCPHDAGSVPEMLLLDSVKLVSGAPQMLHCAGSVPAH